jgi:DNA-binding PadR family transcriptional regulator
VTARRLSRYQLTPEGRKFLLKLMTEDKAKQAQGLGY